MMIQSDQASNCDRGMIMVQIDSREQERRLTTSQGKVRMFRAGLQFQRIPQRDCVAQDALSFCPVERLELVPKGGRQLARKLIQLGAKTRCGPRTGLYY